MSHAFPRAHALVRAAAWSDGGAEFIFSDGTVFSFVDHMNSFVAVRADAAAGKENSNEREMCFTAWTLSSNAEKVRAALAVYNSLSEHPRLFSTLLSTGDQFVSPTPSQQQRGFMSRCATDTEGCGVWREPGPPIHTLLLEKRSNLFKRYTVNGSVREWLVAPEASNAPEASAAKSTHDAGEESGVDTTIFSLHDLQQEKHSRTQEYAPASDKCDAVAKAAGSLPRCVPVGTVLELWCALRRVRLTVAPHRATFTVRWPAPVTRPDGSRLPRSVTPVGVSSAHHAAAAAAATTPLLFTYVEQTFPVQDPPPAWRVMLALALELDAEVPDVDREESCSCSGGAGASHSTMRREPDARPPRAPPSFTHTLIDKADTNCQWLGRLPDPHHWGGTLYNSRIAHPCRFSALTAAQATHLAAPRTTRVLATMRALHSSDVAGDAQLCWLYEAGGVGPSSSPAVYWCLASAAPPLPGVDVVAWVAEDGSAVRVRLEGKGHTVLHERVAAVVSRPAIYRLSAEGAGTAGQRLPPTTAPLRCRVYLSYTNETGESAGSREQSACAGGVAVDNGGGGQPHGKSIELRVVDGSFPASAGVALVDAASLFCAAENGERRPASSISVCASLAMLTAQTHAVNTLQSSASVPAAASMLRDVRHNDQYCAAGSMSAHDARALRGGRYLASVVDVAVQLSQVNCAACRSSCSNALSSTCPSPLQQRNVNAVYSGKASADADAVAAARPEGLVCLTSRLEGIGTFTALTNGTVRGHFADRAIVTLIPGANELDEAQLLATCILRDARRCSIHVAQCRPSHPVFRYLAYMLPFRRYVYLRVSSEIGEQTWCGDASAPSPHLQQQNEERRWERCVSEADRHTDASCVAGLSLVADSAHLLPSLQSSGMVEMEQTAAVPSNSRWGITDSCRTAQSQREREAAVFAEHASRLQEMLEEQDSLSHATRALLRD